MDHDSKQALARFSAATRAWFSESFPSPTPTQHRAWGAIDAGSDCLVVAPTGSGKTLAAFLHEVDRLTTKRQPVGDSPKDHRVSVVYISPLKALAVDVERNLRSPLAGIARHAALLGEPWHDVSVAIRTGDTPAQQRQAMLRRPPDILITTPESLFLMLTSRAAAMLTAVDTVIVDEIHALAGNKRGSHLAVSLQRLDRLNPTRPQRIGLSATVSPVEDVARYLSGSGHEPSVVDASAPPDLKLTIEVTIPDLSDPPAVAVGPTASDAAGEEASPASAPNGTEPIGVWPHIVARLVEQIGAHRSTLVFVNSRRLAERLTGWINAAVDPDRPLAQAHHGSVSKEQRLSIEEALKAGDLRCVVATSSLELGIDMGAIDLVIQVEAPPSVASGLQRVGRAGHNVGDTSFGEVLPKHRGDLLAGIVVSDAMLAGAIEPIRVPRYPLDVLAQQIVAMAAVSEATADEVFAVVRGAAPYTDLPRDLFDGVLDMLDGRYPSAEFSEFRGRIVWDRHSGSLTARPGAQRLVISNAGTIPDRGLFGVFLIGEDERGNKRVGELDEEMVYESRVGDVFRLGASTWRIEDITPDRVLVSPAPGRPARLPYWHGDAMARPYALGLRLGAFLRSVDRIGDLDRAVGVPLSPFARQNLQQYLDEQRLATGVLPNDRRIVVERFRDELGDWRVVVHSLFGARVNAAWAQVIGGRLSEEWGVDAQVMPGDDGIVARLPDVDDEGVIEQIHRALFPTAQQARELITTNIGGTALFAARFRECASRALLLPGRSPGRRRPLWQQRQRSAQLLAVAAKYPRFPITLEAARECLNDVYDLTGLDEVLTAIEEHRIRVVDVETAAPSPFARSLLFAYLASFMYEGDSPLAERRAAALELDPVLLAELLGEADLSDLLDSEAVAEVIAELQWLAMSHRVRDLESAADMVSELGPLGWDAAIDRGADAGWLTELLAQRRIVEVRIGGERLLLDVRHAAMLRDGLGAALPPGIPTTLLGPYPDAALDMVARHLRTHGPTTAALVAAATSLPLPVVEQSLSVLASQGRASYGTFLPDLGAGQQVVDATVLQRLRRRSVAHLQSASEPVPQESLSRFLPHWQGIRSTSDDLSGTDQDLVDVIEQLAGTPLALAHLESSTLPLRVPGYEPADLDALTTSGRVEWWGHGNAGGRDPWIIVAPAAIARDLRPAHRAPQDPDDPIEADILRLLRGGGAWFAPDILTRLRTEGWGGSQASFADALWRLVWTGLASNDSLSAARARLGGRLAAAAGATAGATRAASTRAMRTGRTRLRGVGRPADAVLPAHLGGRWSAVEWAGGAEAGAVASAATIALRHGIVAKGSLAIEDFPGGFAGFYRTASALQSQGSVQRLYVVAGLGGSQFAIPEAVDQIREMRDRPAQDPAPVLVLPATDPANPFGAALPWPPNRGTHRPSRTVGASIVTVGAVPVLYIERGGRSLLTFAAADDSAVLAAACGALVDARTDRSHRSRGGPALQRVDGHPLGLADATDVRAALEAAGFAATPSGWRVRRDAGGASRRSGRT